MTEKCAIAQPSSARLAALESRDTEPALLTLKQLAALLNISMRSAHNLRTEDWFPDAIVLGERSLRWHRDEVLAAVAVSAPRVTTRAEPEQLLQARRYRDGKAVRA